VNIRSKQASYSEPAMNSRPRERIWPLGWLILEGIATVGWLCAITWACLHVAQWLFS
jgi:hypothetical protein